MNAGDYTTECVAEKDVKYTPLLRLVFPVPWRRPMAETPIHQRLDDQPARLMVIGDVHGCVDELATLYARLAPTADDLVVCAGDLVAKGPQSAAVVQFARAHQIRAVLGNHDAHWLRYWQTQDASLLNDAARQQADHMQPEDWAYLAALPLSLAVPAYQTLIVHAGLVPGVPLVEQPPQHLLNLRSILPDGTPTARLVPECAWAEAWHGPEYVIFGHDAMRGLQQTPHALGLDTGCVYGKTLTAVVLPEHRLVTVDAQRIYSVPEKRPAGDAE